jgi:hypothetical protein
MRHVYTAGDRALKRFFEFHREKNNRMVGSMVSI